MAVSPTSNGSATTVALLERIAAATEANGLALRQLADEMAALRAEFETRGAATPNVMTAMPAGFMGTQLVEFQAESIVLTIAEDGQPAYKIKGFPFIKFGVRVWPEVLPQLGVDPDGLKPGTNPFVATVRAVLNEEGKPKKVIGLAS